MNGTTTHGLTAETKNRLLLDGGAIYLHYGLPEEKILSATNGGNTFQVEIETRNVEVDGINSQHIKGLTLKVRETATLAVNLLEMTTENFKMALMGQVDTAIDPDYDIISGKPTIDDDDFIDNIAFAGTISGSAKPVIIILKNVLNLEGFELGAENENDNTLPVTFTAHNSIETPDESPYEIKYPKPTV
jgi:hypothetical protein